MSDGNRNTKVTFLLIVFAVILFSPGPFAILFLIIGAIGHICFNKKIEQESPDFSQERNALFLFFCQLLGVLVPDILFYNLPAHVSQGAHVVAVAPEMAAPEVMVSDFWMCCKEHLCAVSFQILYDICRSMLWLEAYQQMDMIRHNFHFLDTDFFHLGQLQQDIFHLICQLRCRKSRVSVPRYPDQMVMEIINIITLINSSGNSFFLLHVLSLLCLDYTML